MDHYAHGFSVCAHMACVGAICMAVWVAGVEENLAECLCLLLWREPCCSFLIQVGIEKLSEHIQINRTDSSQSAVCHSLSRSPGNSKGFQMILISYLHSTPWSPDFLNDKWRPGVVVLG